MQRPPVRSSAPADASTSGTSNNSGSGNGAGTDEPKPRMREPPQTPFHQQKLKNWSFEFPRFGFSAALILLGIIFIPVGTKLKSISDNVSTTLTRNSSQYFL
jgi:hypothetical protein